MKKSSMAFFFAAALLAVFSGCAKTAPGVVIRGNVTFDGVAIEKGMITFCETDRDQSYAAPIAGGKYELRLQPGDKTVRITAMRQTGTVPRNNFPGDTAEDPVFKSFIPEKYNSRTTLSCTVDRQGGEHDFDLSP